jgi:hypothetical protein
VPTANDHESTGLSVVPVRECVDQDGPTQPERQLDLLPRIRERGFRTTASLFLVEDGTEPREVLTMVRFRSWVHALRS